MKTCERWDTLLPSEEGCLEPAIHRVTYQDGMVLRTCAEHAAEAEERGAEVDRG